MDPAEALAELLSAFHDRDRQAALERLGELRVWIGTGGFLPDPRQAIERFEARQAGRGQPS